MIVSSLEAVFRTEPGVTGEYVTTSEAAELCNVTRFTIRNWILDNKLRASQTAGHHHRILKSDLLKFMKESGIRPAVRSQKIPAFLNCWEYRHLTEAGGHDCERCLVFKEQANRCFLTVHEFGSEKVLCDSDCSECAYMETFFPKEMAIRDMMRSKEKPQAQAIRKVEKVEPEKGSKILAEGIQKSGRYVAAAKNFLTNIKLGKQRKTKIAGFF